MINTIFSAFLGAILGLIATVFFSERYKTLTKRRLLISHLRVELENLVEMNYKKYRYDQVYAHPVSTSLAWTVLQSEILDPRKDYSLISEMHQLVMRMERFNMFTDLFNQASIVNSEKTENLFMHLVMTYEDLFMQVQEVLKEVNSYNFYKSTYFNREFFRFKL
ncbi:hypothetical protein M3664_04960 [Paenibacillus lautus]|uniref:hypothetical protein n=1 Tax=Paenibacillus lautus TaxID=1401 RepID=UPI00203E5681|nr:hypothetical protein [Paenibacillus lautus]MCM3257133.1 hypothetical protein [Paenibacillus lautus]